MYIKIRYSIPVHGNRAIMKSILFVELSFPKSSSLFSTLSPFEIASMNSVRFPIEKMMVYTVTVLLSFLHCRHFYSCGFPYDRLIIRSKKLDLFLSSANPLQR